MKKFLTYLVVVLLVLAGLFRLSLENKSAQEAIFSQLARAMATQRAKGNPEPDSLRVFVCGTASPLGNAGLAQACIAVVTPQHFYLVDVGAGSIANVTAANLPGGRLNGILLTHFHSDHIAEIYEANLASWVQGRPTPLTIFGPRGVSDVVRGINQAYAHDREYRTAHHGADLLPPDLGELKSDTIKPGLVLEDGDLTITAYLANHEPVSPAVGYRFDYRGRSVVVSGDSLVTDETRQIVKDADLLLHDALSTFMVTTMATASSGAGLDRLSKIMTDVLDYHASTDDLVELGKATNVNMVAYYHLVPVPGNFLQRKLFEQGLPDNYMIALDGTWFDLPADSNEISVIEP